MSKITQRIALLLGGFLVVAAFTVLPLSADVIATDLNTSVSPYYATNTGDAWTVGGNPDGEIAVGFIDPSAVSSYSLTQIQLADNFFTPDPNGTVANGLNNLMVSLWASPTNLNSPSATVIESWNILPPLTLATPQLFTLTPSSSTTPSIDPVISPSENYFITESVAPDSLNTAVWGWQENILAPLQIGFYAAPYSTPASFSLSDTPCDPAAACTAENPSDPSGTPAFSVSGVVVTQSAVPEPRDYAGLLAVWFAGILLLRRRTIHA